MADANNCWVCPKCGKTLIGNKEYGCPFCAPDDLESFLRSNFSVSADMDFTGVLTDDEEELFKK